LIKYILRRLLVLPVIMLLVTGILFFMILQLPAEQRAQTYMYSGNPHKTSEQARQVMEATIERHGLNRSFLIQYVNWLRNLVQGQWGFSPTWRQPVLEGLLQRAPATIELTLFATIPSVVLALILGGLAARHQNRFPDYVIRAATFIGWAFPHFILGLIMMNIFYAWLHWFPPERLSVWANLVVKSDSFRTVTGMHTVDALLNGEWGVFGDAVRHLVLPGVTLAVAQWALLTRVMRNSMLGTLQEDYITMARAKGLREQEVVNVHARRNAILPVISTAGAAISMFVSSVVVIEVLFYINGVGRWAVEAVTHLDIPVVVGFALLSCLFIVLMSLVADILYAVADPRVRLD
jgi:peptide/nickel transport system permease protein